MAQLERPSDKSIVLPHPLDQLSIQESDYARQVILDARGRGSRVAINFRSIFLNEPPKHELSRFLELENAGRVTPRTPRPARVAKVQYDVIRNDRKHEYTESCVDVLSGREVQQRVVEKMHQAALTL
jgi:primary-amine oxidase